LAESDSTANIFWVSTVGRRASFLLQ